MRQAFVRWVGMLAVALLATGCAAVWVRGSSPTGSSGAGRGVDDVAPAQLPITGATDGAVDQLVRNALADLSTFWSQAFPQTFGQPFRPLAGGVFSVDSRNIDRSAYPPTGIGCAEQPIPPSQVAGNAFYNPACDAIAYDRALLTTLARDYGRTLPAVVLAHEFGHAVQGRVGFAPGGRSIQDETQADCFAGAWTAWEVAGRGDHLTIEKSQLDAILRGYLTLRDPIGSDPDNQQAHGSFFDRVSAFSDGYDKGADFCRTGFGPDRVFTQAPFTRVEDYVEGGNSTYSQTLGILDDTLPPFWSGVFQQSFGRSFQEPAVRAFQGRAPSCLSGGDGQRELGFCGSQDTVYYDETDLTGPAYERIGDWAVATAVSLPYAEAVRAQLGRSTTDDAATRSEVCLTGWYTRALFDKQFAQVAVLSPGDVDEGVVFLLSYGVSDRVFPDSEATGFDLLRAYRDGFLQRGSACDVGL